VVTVAGSKALNHYHLFCDILGTSPCGRGVRLLNWLDTHCWLTIWQLEILATPAMWQVIIGMILAS